MDKLNIKPIKIIFFLITLMLIFNKKVKEILY